MLAKMSMGMVTRSKTKSKKKKETEDSPSEMDMAQEEEEEKMMDSDKKMKMMMMNRPHMLDHADPAEEETPEQIVPDEGDFSDSSSYSSTSRFDAQEIVTGLFFGGEGCGMDAKGREKHGVTHMLTIISAFEQSFEVDQEMLLAGRWKVFDRENRPTADLLNVLDDCVDFIHEALSSHGKICIHSLEGESRSVTVCLAYLVKTLGMTLRSAVELIESHKPVKINRGFWRQILAYEKAVRGAASYAEDELPGAILFEKDDLNRIINRFNQSKNISHPSPINPFHGQMSPTSATGIGLMSLGSPNNPHKRPFDWKAVSSSSSASLDSEASDGSSRKSPRSGFQI